MARDLLTARQVHVAVDGDRGDGPMMRVNGNRASWVFGYAAPSGNRRQQGQGAAVRDNIAEAGKRTTPARDKADKSRELLRDGIDPIEHVLGRQVIG